MWDLERPILLGGVVVTVTTVFLQDKGLWALNGVLGVAKSLLLRFICDRVSLLEVVNRFPFGVITFILGIFSFASLGVIAQFFLGVFFGVFLGVFTSINTGQIFTVGMFSFAAANELRLICFSCMQSCRVKVVLFQLKFLVIYRITKQRKGSNSLSKKYRYFLRFILGRVFKLWCNAVAKLTAYLKVSISGEHSGLHKRILVDVFSPGLCGRRRAYRHATAAAPAAALRLKK